MIASFSLKTFRKYLTDSGNENGQKSARLLQKLNVQTSVIRLEAAESVCYNTAKNERSDIYEALFGV